MNNYFNIHRLWFKTVATGVVCLFLLNNFSFALEPTTGQRSCHTLSPQSRFPFVIKDRVNETELTQRLQNDAGLIYVSLLIGKVLAANGSVISDRGLRTLIERHILHIEPVSFDWENLRKEGKTFCLPYTEKGGNRTRILRYYLPEDKPEEAIGKRSIPLGTGNARVILEDTRVDVSESVFIFNVGTDDIKGGTGRELYETNRIAQGIYDRAAEALGCDVSMLFLEEKNRGITERWAVGNILYGVALYAAFSGRMETNDAPIALAGNSMGEIGALIVSGAVSLEDGVRLARFCGHFFETVVDKVDYGVVILEGIESDAIKGFLDPGKVELFQDVSPSSISLAVSRDVDHEELVNRLKEAGARRAQYFEKPLVKGSHVSWYSRYGQGLVDQIREMKISDPEIPVISPATGEILTTADQVREDIQTQFFRPIAWRGVVDKAVESGARSMLAFGPGWRIIKRTESMGSGIEIIPATDLAELESLKHKVRGFGSENLRPDIGTVVKGQDGHTYEIKEIITTGGTAIIFGARDMETSKNVAIKFLDFSIVPEPEEFIKLFKREVDVLKKGFTFAPGFYDWNIVDDPKGYGWIAMEKLEGVELWKWAADKYQDQTIGVQEKVRDIVEIVQKVLNHMSALYENGIQYREVNRKNIIVTPESEPKLVDFVGACVPGHDPIPLNKLPCTPNYLPPDRHREIKLKGPGVLDDVTTPQYDVFQMGVLLFHLARMTGPPDDGSYWDVSFTYETYTREKIEDMLPPAWKRFAGVIFKATARELEDRYESAEEMKRAIEEQEDAPGSEGFGDGTHGPDFGKSNRKKFCLVAMGAVSPWVVLILLAGMVICDMVYGVINHERFYQVILNKHPKLTLALKNLFYRQYLPDLISKPLQRWAVSALGRLMDKIKEFTDKLPGIRFRDPVVVMEAELAGTGDKVISDIGFQVPIVFEMSKSGRKGRGRGSNKRRKQMSKRPPAAEEPKPYDDLISCAGYALNNLVIVREQPEMLQAAKDFYAYLSEAGKDILDQLNIDENKLQDIRSILEGRGLSPDMVRCLRQDAEIITGRTKGKGTVKASPKRFSDDYEIVEVADVKTLVPVIMYVQEMKAREVTDAELSLYAVTDDDLRKGVRMPEKLPAAKEMLYRKALRNLKDVNWYKRGWQEVQGLSPANKRFLKEKAEEICGDKLEKCWGFVEGISSEQDYAEKLMRTEIATVNSMRDFTEFIILLACIYGGEQTHDEMRVALENIEKEHENAALLGDAPVLDRLDEDVSVNVGTFAKIAFSFLEHEKGLERDSKEYRAILDAVRRINSSAKVQCRPESSERWIRDFLAWIHAGFRYYLMPKGGEIYDDRHGPGVLREGGAIVPGRAVTPFTLVSGAVKTSDAELFSAEAGKLGIFTYVLPPGFVTCRISSTGRNIILKTGHIDVVMGVVPPEFTSDGRAKLLMDPSYHNLVKDNPEFLRLLEEQGSNMDVVLIHPEETYLNLANFSSLLDENGQVKLLFNHDKGLTLPYLNLKTGVLFQTDMEITGMAVLRGLVRCMTNMLPGSYVKGGASTSIVIRDSGMPPGVATGLHALSKDPELKRVLQELWINRLTITGTKFRPMSLVHYDSSTRRILVQLGNDLVNDPSAACDYVINYLEATRQRLCQDMGISVQGFGDTRQMGGSAPAPAGMFPWMWRVYDPIKRGLEKRDWPARRIAGLIGGLEELGIAGLVMNGAAFALSYFCGMPFITALLVTSAVAVPFFPAGHIRGRYYIQGGGFAPALPSNFWKDMGVLTVLGLTTRSLQLLPVAMVCVFNLNPAFTLVGIPLAVIAHAYYNHSVAPERNRPLGMPWKGKPHKWTPERISEELRMMYFDGVDSRGVKCTREDLRIEKIRDHYQGLAVAVPRTWKEMLKEQGVSENSRLYIYMSGEGRNPREGINKAGWEYFWATIGVNYERDIEKKPGAAEGAYIPNATDSGIEHRDLKKFVPEEDELFGIVREMLGGEDLTEHEIADIILNAPDDVISDDQRFILREYCGLNKSGVATMVKDIAEEMGISVRGTAGNKFLARFCC